jgi:peptidyl-prolyl cis-trans isomerase D
MAVLQNMRVKFGVFITVLIALALLSFIIDPDTLRQAMSSMSSKNDVGKMGGEKISYREFEEKADYFTKIQQTIFGKTSNTEEDQDQINNTAWNSFLEKYVYLPAIEKAGVKVCDDEIVDLTQGDHISPVISQDPVFRDASGSFSHDRLLEFIKASNEEPNGAYANYWDYVESNIKNQQMFEKYTSLLTKSNILNKVELARSISENNVTSDVDFVMVPYSFAADSSVTVTSDEIQKYYDARKKNFKQKASRDIVYAVFDIVPSNDDIAKVQEETEPVYEEFKTADNMKQFLAKNSDTPLNDYFFKKGELATEYPELDSLAFGGKGGEKVSPLFKKGNNFVAGRIMAEKEVPDSVFLQHILLQGANEAKADSILDAVRKGGDFAALATKYSADQNTQVAQRGDLGWVTERYNIPGFEGVFDMQVGVPAIMKSQYGTHVVVVKERTKPVHKVQFAVLTKAIPVGKTTYQNIYSQANNLVSASKGKLDSLQSAAKTAGVELIPANKVLEGARTIGSYEGVREISRWAFDAKVGDVSQVLTIGDHFFVAGLTGTHKEGFTPVEELASTIKMELMSQKSAEKKNKEIADKIKGMTSLDQIATALGASISHKDGISFGSFNADQLDQKFIGAVSVAEKGAISGPVQGQIASYVFSVTNRNTGSFFTETDAKNRNDQINQRELGALSQIFQDNASVTDNRARFF